MFTDGSSNQYIMKLRNQLFNRKGGGGSNLKYKLISTQKQ